jgi:hypothetical protein
VVGGLVSIALIALAANPPNFGAAAIAPPNVGERGAPLFGSARGVALASALAIPLFVLPAASAVYGYSTVNSCVDAKAELAARLTVVPDSPSN